MAGSSLQLPSRICFFSKQSLLRRARSRHSRRRSAAIGRGSSRLSCICVQSSPRSCGCGWLRRCTWWQRSCGSCLIDELRSHCMVITPNRPANPDTRRNAAPYKRRWARAPVAGTVRLQVLAGRKGGRMTAKTPSRRGRIPCVGILSPSPTLPSQARWNAFKDALRELGYFEGTNIRFEYRSAEGEFERLPSLVIELVRRSVDVMVAANPPGIDAARAATSSIPIVFPVGSDPVETGLVASMERPGGNVTGVAAMSWRLSRNRLELLCQVAPSVSRVGLLRHLPNAGLERQVRESKLAAEALRVELQILEVSTSADFAPTIEAAVERGITALATLSDPFVLSHTENVVALALEHRLPAVSPFSAFVEARGLMSFGPDINQLYRRGAWYVDQILRGISPADLPIAEPTESELCFNLATAMTLGLHIPATLLARADHVLK